VAATVPGVPEQTGERSVADVNRRQRTHIHKSHIFSNVNLPPTS